MADAQDVEKELVAVMKALSLADKKKLLKRATDLQEVADGKRKKVQDVVEEVLKVLWKVDHGRPKLSLFSKDCMWSSRFNAPKTLKAEFSALFGHGSYVVVECDEDFHSSYGEEAEFCRNVVYMMKLPPGCVLFMIRLGVPFRYVEASNESEWAPIKTLLSRKLKQVRTHAEKAKASKHTIHFLNYPAANKHIQFWMKHGSAAGEDQKLDGAITFSFPSVDDRKLKEFKIKLG